MQGNNCEKKGVCSRQMFHEKSVVCSKRQLCEKRSVCPRQCMYNNNIRVEEKAITSEQDKNKNRKATAGKGKGMKHKSGRETKGKTRHNERDWEKESKTIS